MRCIQKRISLERLTSRLPSVVPSYLDETLYHFDIASVKNRIYLYPTNYGMFPCSLPMKGLLSDIGSFGTIDNVLTKNCGDAVMVSFQSLSGIYFFFREYYDLLVKYATCKKFYESATAYYDQEIKMNGGTELRYGSDRSYYERLDEVFEGLGGKVKVSSDKSRIEDEGFYKWICDYIVPSYTISDEYTDYWNATKLYYADAIRWYSWFEDKHRKYANVTDCDETEDCCECAEYFGRGGNDTYDSLGEWIRGTDSNIRTLNGYIDDTLGCSEPKLMFGVSLLSNIEDIGLHTIFSTEYDVNVDYRTLDGYTEKYGTETCGRTVVEYEGETLILSGNGKDTGVEFEESFLEKRIDRDKWKSYFEDYEVKNPKKFYSSDDYNYYGFDGEGNKVTGDSTADVVTKLSHESFGVTSADVIVDGDTMISISRDEYGYSRPNKDGSKKLYIVERDPKTDVPYTFYDGKPRFGKLTKIGNNTCYTFDFIVEGDRPKGFDLTSKNVAASAKIEHFAYNDYDYVISSSTRVCINQEIIDLKSSGSPINRVDGYSDTSSGRIWIIDNSAYINGGINVVRDDTITVERGFVTVPTETEGIEVYASNMITGVSSSKLESLRSYRVMTDDIGNEIPSSKDVTIGYHYQPKEGEELEPIYQVGNVANVAEFSMTKKDNEDLKQSDIENFYCGDILTDMVFYYKYLGGEAAESTKVTASTSVSSLQAILQSTTAKNTEEEQGKFFEDVIYCDVVYYIGATLVRKKSGFSVANGYHHGVRYEETVMFNREEVQYYTKSADEHVDEEAFTEPYNHSISYPVYVYTMSQEQKEIITNYGSVYYTPVARFSMQIWANGEDKWPRDMEKRNGLDVSPIIMEEVNIGVSAPQNITSDIYIDRGISALFERQLKLGEVSTLEALEAYGQGFFKINN